MLILTVFVNLLATLEGTLRSFFFYKSQVAVLFCTTVFKQIVSLLGMGRLTNIYRYVVMHVHDASASVEQQRVNEILEANRDASVFARCIGFSEIQLILLIQNIFLYLLTSVVNLFFAHNLIDLHKVGLSNDLRMCVHYNSMYQLRG